MSFAYVDTRSISRQPDAAFQILDDLHPLGGNDLSHASGNSIWRLKTKIVIVFCFSDSETSTKCFLMMLFWFPENLNTLTGKNCGLEERAPMCGVPFHSADSYIEKLIEKGYKVAICEQVEDPREAKGLVKREVVQIVTPGTITSSNLLNESENNYIASAFVTAETVGFAYCDISTGEICVTQISDGDNESSLWNELVRIDASEAIINDSASNFISLDYLENVLNIYVGNKPEEYFSLDRKSVV